MRSEPTLDWVIAVHDLTRPVERAVASLLESGLALPADLRITVVCHGVPAVHIAETLSPRIRGSVRLLEYADGIGSPAGPFMYGLRAATGEFAGIMGSDDTLEPGALAAWLERVRERRLDVLIPREVRGDGSRNATPPTRWRRSAPLHPLKDRLAYRSAPLGIFRRRLLDELGLDMSPRLPSGEDQLFALKLWFSGRRIAYGRGLPAYRVGVDARGRVTHARRPVAKELLAIRELVKDPWFTVRAARERRAIVVKSVRIPVFGAAQARSEQDRWTDEDRHGIADLLALLADAAPDYRRSLSIVDRRILDALERGDFEPSALHGLLRDRQRYRRAATLLARDPRGVLAVDGPLRLLVAAKLLD